MKNQKTLLVVSAGLALLLCALSAFGLYQYTTRSDEPVVVATSPMQVTLSAPENNGRFPLNTPIPIPARADGDAVTIMELWADDALVAALDVSGQDGVARAEWRWVPATEGIHFLLVRARDDGGQTAVSNIIQLDITAPILPHMQIEAQAGDSIAALAAAYGAEPDELRPAVRDEASGAWNVSTDLPAADPQPPLEAGQPVLIPVEVAPAPSEPKSPAFQPPAGAIPAQELADGAIGSDSPAAIPPAAPQLSGQAAACAVMLFISDKADNEDGFFVYRQAAGQSFMERIATLAPGAGDPLQFVDSAPAQNAVYLVAAFNSAGESQSNPVTVEVGDGCVADGGQTAVFTPTFIGTKLFLPQTVDAAYVYLSPDGENWQRVPEGESEFIAPEGGNQIDLGKFMPQAGDGMIVADAWGWSSSALSHLGESSYDDEGIMQLRACYPAGACKDTSSIVTEIDYDWNAFDVYQEFIWYRGATMAETAVDKVVWQLSPVPFPAGAQLIPNIYTDEKETGGSDEGLFAIDFSHLLSPYQHTWYVRLIPYRDGKPAGEPSNPVAIHVGPPPPQSDVELYPLSAIYDVEILEFRPLHFPEQGVCTGAVILDTDWTPIMGDTVPAGTRICPQTYRGEGEDAWYESLLDFVGGAVNWVSKAYESLKEAIIDLVGGIVCGGDEACKDVLMVGLNAGLVALGVPPSLPNFDQLMEQGMTYLAAVAVDELTGTDAAQTLLEQAEELGISKEDAEQWAEEQIRQGIETAVNEMSRAQNPTCVGEEAAHSMGVEPLCFPEGVTSHLDPAGQYIPASVIVRVTRKTDMPYEPTAEELERYILSVSVTASNYSDQPRSVWVQRTSSWLPVEEPLAGSLFASTGKRIPPIEPGASLTIPMVLQPADFWAPGHQEAEAGVIMTRCDDYSCTTLTRNDFWALYDGGLATVTATVDPCFAIGGAQSGMCEVAVDSCTNIPIPGRDAPVTTFCEP